MPTAELTKLLTTADLLAMSDDGVDRWLIRGELRERTATKRNRWHSLVMAAVVEQLVQWRLRTSAEGRTLCGEAGCILTHDPETAVGIDVAWFSQAVLDEQTDETSMIDGAPVLAIEIPSPSDTLQSIDEKNDAYLSAGVQLVWNVNPHDRTVMVFTPERLPALYNTSQIIPESAALPGLTIAVQDLFPY